MSRILAEPLAEAAVVLRERPGGLGLSDLARLVGRSPSTLQRSLASLETAGVVTRRGSTRPVYRLTERRVARALTEVATELLDREHVQRLVERARRERDDREMRVEAVRRRVAKMVGRMRLTGAVDESLPLAVGRLVVAMDPRQVILFGSHARGDAQPDSDVDLLVVLDRVDDARECRVAARRLLADLPFAKDILVAAATEIAGRGAVKGTVLHSALTEGVVLYER